ncbi:hypothetical protein RR46_05330 [Papilio xuthus]|uniref:Uncharacterized protein n=1 Tax=Papilio xuthus TaxID=66420 RepID=A0A194Q7U8_PAPXU|nr:hypothetical protein RR46_05330 [Papilio xuthus]
MRSALAIATCTQHNDNLCMCPDATHNGLIQYQTGVTQNMTVSGMIEAKCSLPQTELLEHLDD